MLQQSSCSLCQSLPPDALEQFDRRRFEASLPSWLIRLRMGGWSKHLESFAAANKALLFYDECGEKYPADTGRWLMALVNQGTALAAFRCFQATLKRLSSGQKKFSSCKGLDTPENKQWIEMVDGNIAALNAHLQKQSSNRLCF